MTLKGEWSSGTAYVAGDVMRYPNGIFYQCVKNAKAGTPCPDALYFNPLPSPLQEVAKMTMDMIASTNTKMAADIDSSLAIIAPEYTKTTYSKGAIRKHEGKLYKAKQNINTAESWKSSHWQEITVAEVLVSLNTAVATIPTNISSSAVTLTTATASYNVTVDDSGEAPELAVTAVAGGGT